MAYSTPTTRADGYVVDASEWNKNTVDNPIALRTGEIAIASQATGDIPVASSASQWGRSTVAALGLHTIVQGRLTLTTATPVTTADVTAATTLYFALYGGAQIGLYDGTSRWVVSTIAELSIAVPATTDTMYDVFVDYADGTPALAVTAWTNDTTRATALTKQDGIYVKTGDTQQRYVGSFRTTGVSGQTEDSLAKRYVWNYYNRVTRPLRRLETTNSWNYNTATIRQANASTANQVDVVCGVAEDAIDLTLAVNVSNTTGGLVFFAVMIGEDSTTAKHAGCLSAQVNNGASERIFLTSHLKTIPAVGRHYYTWLEFSDTTATTTFVGDNNSPTIDQSGLVGMWRA